MPTWVARQWQVLRAPRAAIGARCRIQHPPGHVGVLNLRTYAQQSSQDGGSTSKLGTANSAIIIPSSVSGIQPEELIAHIQPIDRRRLTKDRFAVFFLTPAIAPWLLDDKVFLHKALRQAYKHLLGPKGPHARIHALCAVVDKLPTPKAIGDVESLEKEARDRMRIPPVRETGLEGLAYAIHGFSDSISSSSPLAEDKAAISFVTSEGSEDEGLVGDTLRLPLANTVFQTGSPTTMTLSTWERHKGSDDLTLKSNQSITHHGIKLHRRGVDKQRNSALAVPLVPLTLPRQVDASMGNILRRVIGPEGKSITASQELEQTVPQFFASRGEPPQAMSVWALVIPKDLLQSVSRETDMLLRRLPDQVGFGAPRTEKESWEFLWKRDPPLWNELIPTALAAGARLHRVLSGGGGWGKKAGLLALDPVAALEDMEPSVAQTDDSMFDGPGDLSSALQQVAHHGDSIQFFISPTGGFPDVTEPKERVEKLKELTASKTPWSWELGTIPSTVDSLSADPWQHNPSETREVFVFRNTFGALTEGGITLKRQFKLRSNTFAVIGGTKVDVPFSRYSVVNLASEEEDAEEKSIQNCLDSQYYGYHEALVRRLYDEDVPPLLGIRRLDTSRREPQDISRPKPLNISRLNLPPDDAPMAPNDKSVVNRVRLVRILARVDQNVKLRRKVRVFKDSFGEQPSAPIRFYRAARIESRYCANKLRQTQKAVQHLTYEYRLLVNGIRTWNRRYGQIPRELYRVMATVSAFEKEMESVIFNSRLNWLADQVDRSDGRVYALQKAFKNVLDRFTNRVFDTTVGHITQHITQLRNETARILRTISLRAQLAHAANNSAVDVYQLHIALRWRLAAMILTRQRHSHPHPLARGIMPLEKKLVALRAYSENLFFSNPTLEEASITHHLAALESAHPILRALKLSEAAHRRLSIARLPATEQQARHRNRTIRQVLKGRGLPANRRIRKTFAPTYRAGPSGRLRGSSSRKPLGGHVVPTLKIKKYARAEPGARLRTNVHGAVLSEKERRERRRKRLGFKAVARETYMQLRRRERKGLLGRVEGWLDGGSGGGGRDPFGGDSSGNDSSNDDAFGGGSSGEHTSGNEAFGKDLSSAKAFGRETPGKEDSDEAFGEDVFGADGRRKWGRRGG